MQAVEQKPLLSPGVDVYIVEQEDNPSTSYFVSPACTGDGRRVHRCRFDELPLPAELEGAVVVFVRYVPGPWRRLVTAERARLVGLVYFMDDDVLDPAASVGMPWRYRYKLYNLAARHTPWLRRMRAQLWVSTPWLAHKYARWLPRLVVPQAASLSAARVCRVFYHGSASHEAEIRWLQPILAQVLEQDERVLFEVVGGRDVYRLYRGLPRVTVVHPMKWPTFLAFTDTPGRHIGLAPMLDLPFNHARSCTKFFDITRCGAVGIYADSSTCAGMVRDGVDGLLLPMQPQQWVATILQLVRDESLRLQLLHGARARLKDYR